MTWVIAKVIKSDKDTVGVSGEWETKLLNETYLTQRAGSRSWDNSPIKRNSDSAWEKSYSYSLEHGKDEVAVVFTAEDNCSWLHGYNGANLAGIRHMLQVSINIPVEEQQPFKEYMMEVLRSA
jgi:hypothetical protein